MRTAVCYAGVITSRQETDRVRITTLLNQLLSLQGAWVQAVALDFDTLTVRIKPTASKHRCPSGTFCTWARYDHNERTWRHLGACWSNGSDAGGADIWFPCFRRGGKQTRDATGARAPMHRSEAGALGAPPPA